MIFVTDFHTVILIPNLALLKPKLLPNEKKNKVYKLSLKKKKKIVGTKRMKEKVKKKKHLKMALPISTDRKI